MRKRNALGEMNRRAINSGKAFEDELKKKYEIEEVIKLTGRPSKKAQREKIGPSPFFFFLCDPPLPPSFKPPNPPFIRSLKKLIKYRDHGFVPGLLIFA